MPTRIRRFRSEARPLAAAALLATTLGPLAGCYFERSGSPRRLTTPAARVPDEAWPPVPDHLLDEVTFASRDTSPLGPAPAGAFLAALGAPAAGEATWRRDLPADALASLRTPVGLVRVRVTRDGRPFDAPVDFLSLFRGFAANTFVQSGLTFGTPAEELSAAVNLEARVVPSDGLAQGRCAPAVVLDARAPADAGIAVRIPPVLPPTPRGVILHLWALMSNPYEQEVMAEFTRRGWLVVDIDTRTGVTPEVHEQDIPHAVDLQRRVNALRAKLPPWDGRTSLEEVWAQRRAMPESAEIDRLETELSDLRGPATVVTRPEQAEPVGRRIAAQIDATLAANAYAAEASLKAVHTVYPQTATLPTVVMGFSAGALSAPTVAARLRDKVRAVVIIGGAANLLETAVNSSLTDGGLRLLGHPDTPEERQTPRRERENRPAPSLLSAISKAYLAASRLDPYHTAPALRGLPVLQVHAWWDTWVPAENGALLDERLEHPDRLAMPGGHGMLFYFLPKRKQWIADWVERHAPAAQP